MEVDQRIHQFQNFNATSYDQDLVPESGSEQQVEGAFLELRNALSFLSQEKEAVSDLDVLKLAMEYIASMESVLEIKPKQS